MSNGSSGPPDDPRGTDGKRATEDKGTSGRAAGGGRPSPATRQTGNLVLIVAGGYPGWGNQEKELRAYRNHNWLPSTPDFEATAKLTQGGCHHSATTPSEFFKALKAHQSISRVVFIGHGSILGRQYVRQPKGLGLSAASRGGETNFWIDSDTIAKHRVDIARRIAPKLLPNATIDLVACHVAGNNDFMKAMARAFGVPIRGFSGTIDWLLRLEDGNLVRGEIGIPRTYTREDIYDQIAEGGLPVGTTYAAKYRGVRDLVPPVEFRP